MSLGPVMLGLEGPTLSPEETEILQHPLVGGVILFSRNYQSPEQLTQLTESVHRLRKPPLLVAVDQEGGRVQRFQTGFTRLPALRRLGEINDKDPGRAPHLARICGWLMATELRAVGVDFSFAPVLDLDRGISSVIGDRAFHRDPAVVSKLAQAYMEGMQKAGMEAVGKHFPGHGGVEADSHLALPVDHRPYADIAANDMIPFQRLMNADLAGIMPAHVVYSEVDERPAGFSSLWLNQILRQRLGFQGAIFSDDLDMAGAAAAGPPAERAKAALAAGCDMVLACNDRPAAMAILRGLEELGDPAVHLRLVRLHGRDGLDYAHMRQSEAWQRAVGYAQDLDAFPLLGV